MLKGHVFSKQLFGNPIFALFINTFLNGTNGISSNFKNAMALSYSGSIVTVQSGAVCIQGRFLEEDTSTSISAGVENAFCKLVIEVDLDKQNTENDFQQGAYKIIKGANNYVNLTQNNIVKNNSGIYQYELARFKTSSSGITEFKDMRTFLDFTSIYNKITEEYREALSELEKELASVIDGSSYLLKSGGTMNGDINMQNNNIKFSTGPIEWKENNFGDKFRVIPDFSGTDDSNVFKVQGAVGATGTDPDFYDLATISAKSGNMELKGSMNAKGGFIGDVKGNITGNCSGSSGSCTRKCSNSY